MMQLSEICDIRMGFSARGRVEPVERGGIPYVQLNDVNATGVVDAEKLTNANLPDIDDRYRLTSHDIVFRSRGAHNIGALVQGADKNVVALAPLTILRPRRDIVLPEYLVWFISQSPAQRHFDAGARGSNIRMIPRDHLARLEVDVPDMETQRRIVEVADLVKRESELSELLAHKKSEMMSFVLLEQARKTQPRANEVGF